MITKHHATPQADFDKYADYPVHSIVASTPVVVYQHYSSFVSVAHGRNELASDPSTAPPVLVFSAFRNERWVGNFTSLEAAKQAAGLNDD
jgi:hypothetical protein